MMPCATALGRIAVISAVTVVLASPAMAQATASNSSAQAGTALPGTPAFAEQVAGRTVRITTTDGVRRKVRVLSLTKTEMVVVGGTPVPFARTALVEKVSHRVRNSTLIGLAAGLVAGTAATVACGDPGECDPGLVLYVGGGIGAGAGAAVGAIWQASRGDRDVIYDARKRTTTMGFSPIVSPTRKGLAFSMSWR
jgi:hypothetical protein